MFLLMSNTSGFFSILAAMWSKTSFAITVLRISNGWMKGLIWFIILSVNISLGFGALSTYIQCSPTEKLWKPSIPGKCWPKEFIISYQVFTAGQYSNAISLGIWKANVAVAYSGTMDIVLAILPWWIIWPLTMSTKEKVGVLLAMSMGVLYVLDSRIVSGCFHANSRTQCRNCVSRQNHATFRYQQTRLE